MKSWHVPKKLTAALLVAMLVCGCGAPTVPLPSGAPLRLTECGWPADTLLAFAGWAELHQLGLADSSGHMNSTEGVFAIVSSERTEQHTMQGDPVIGRGICARHANGDLEMGTVPDDWQPPSR